MFIANTIAEIFMEQAMEIMKVENVQIIDKAILPTSPVKPNVRMNILISAVLGFMLGCMLIFLIHYFDRTIRTPDDIKKHIELPIVGLIPFYRKNKKREVNRIDI